MEEIKAYSITKWLIECPVCEKEFQIPDDDGKSGAYFTAECKHCGHQFSARAM